MKSNCAKRVGVGDSIYLLKHCVRELEPGVVEKKRWTKNIGVSLQTVFASWFLFFPIMSVTESLAFVISVPISFSKPPNFFYFKTIYLCMSYTIV